jgi:hypothetical protein
MTHELLLQKRLCSCARSKLLLQTWSPDDDLVLLHCLSGGGQPQLHLLLQTRLLL